MDLKKIYSIISVVLLWLILALAYEAITVNEDWWTGFKLGLFYMFIPSIGVFIFYAFLAIRNKKRN